MAEALYDRENGYYTQGGERVGKGGDFFTSVSVGSLYGELLAERFHKWWQECGSPGEFYILEYGGNNADLALDVLGGVSELGGDFARAVRYAIVEHLPCMRDVQEKRLEGRANAFACGSVEDALEALGVVRGKGDGVIFGNELLDAFPVDVAVVEGGVWKERRVGEGEGGKLEWVTCGELPVLGGVEEWVERPEAPPVDPAGLPEGMVTEWCPGLPEFFRGLGGIFGRELVVFADYALTNGQYHDPGRKGGTLRTFSGHKRGDDPLDSPGERDITADVNMDLVEASARGAGFTRTEWKEQGRWLTPLAVRKMREIEGGKGDLAGFVRQFQSLTHPGSLGTRFKVFEGVWQEGSAGREA